MQTEAGERIGKTLKRRLRAKKKTGLGHCAAPDRGFGPRACRSQARVSRVDADPTKAVGLSRNGTCLDIELD